MNGYSRITHTGLQKSRSSDFSDLIFIPTQTAPKSHQQQQQQQQSGQIPTMMNNCSNTHDLNQSQEPEDGVGEIFGVILGRRYSAAAAASASFHGVSGCEKHSSAAVDGGCAVKRAFSMRRSSSVTEGYSRIHHLQYGCDDRGSFGTMQRRSKKKTSILKACRRLFGF